MTTERSKKSIILYTLLIPILLVITSVIVALYWPQNNMRRSTKITINRGESLSIISNKLLKSGVITNELFFGLATKIMGLEKSIPVGSYEFKNVNIGALIFNIGSKNKFCSHLYAKLYRELSNIYVEFSLISDKHYETYGRIFDEINYVDPDTDYNLYCDYNKQNENRKTMSLFFTNLMKHGVFQKGQIMDLIFRLIKNVETNILEENNIEVVEETVTNLLIFILEGGNELNNYENWSEVTNHIEKMSNAKKKDYKSLTTKTIFKYMDLLEQLED